VHYLDSWVKRDEPDVTCFIISLFNAQHVSDVNTSILRILRLICWVISWVVLLWFDVCWCKEIIKQVTSSWSLFTQNKINLEIYKTHLDWNELQVAIQIIRNLFSYAKFGKVARLLAALWMDCGLDSWRDAVLIPRLDRLLLVWRPVHKWGPSRLLFNGRADLFLGDYSDRTVMRTDQPHFCGDCEWSHASTSPYAFMLYTGKLLTFLRVTGLN